MANTSLKAPAKLNLTLEVLGRRPDGYHEVRTVLQAVDLADRLTFGPADGLTLEVDPESPVSVADVPVEGNLVLKAAQLLRQETDVEAGALIKLYKRVPVAVGLGGGSSDAATALLGLRRLWNVDIQERRLLNLAARLGSDVPFFIRGGTALGAGRGEELTPLPTPSQPWAVVLVPPDAPGPQKTARLYGLLTLAHHAAGPLATTEMVRRISAGETFGECMVNVFDRVAAKAYPDHERPREALRSVGAERLLLAGAGPALFTLTTDQASAEWLAHQLEANGHSAYAARFLPAWSLDGLPA